MSTKSQTDSTATLDHDDTIFGNGDDMIETLDHSLNGGNNDLIPFGCDSNTPNEAASPSSQGEETSASSESTVTEDFTIPNTSTVSNTIIAHKESQEVRRYKIIVLVMMFGMCAFVAACVYCYIMRSERKHFEDHFKESASIVLEGVGNSIARTLTPLDSLAVSLVSYARATNNSWPYVTYPDYALRLSKLMPFTDAMLIEYMPLVQPEQKTTWELYCSEHNQWVNESIKLQDSWDKYTGPIIYDWEPSDKIFSDDGAIKSNIRYVHRIKFFLALIYVSHTLNKSFTTSQSCHGTELAGVSSYPKGKLIRDVMYIAAIIPI